jgi:transcriptional regulator with XRE-family HTH domain
MRKSLSSPDYQLLLSMLRQAREDRGISQALVGRILGISASQLGKWERCERRVDASEIRLYCKAMGVPIAELIAEWDRQVSEEEIGQRQS